MCNQVIDSQVKRKASIKEHSLNYFLRGNRVDTRYYKVIHLIAIYDAVITKYIDRSILCFVLLFDLERKFIADNNLLSIAYSPLPLVDWIEM